jgi:hypothetical protein
MAPLDQIARRNAEAVAYAEELADSGFFPYEYQIAMHLAGIERFVFDLTVAEQRQGMTEDEIVAFWEALADFKPGRSAPDTHPSVNPT